VCRDGDSSAAAGGAAAWTVLCCVCVNRGRSRPLLPTLRWHDTASVRAARLRDGCCSARITCGAMAVMDAAWSSPVCGVLHSMCDGRARPADRTAVTPTVATTRMTRKLRVQAHAVVESH
jgi:hypothetical protein